MIEAKDLLANSQQMRTRNANGRMENHLYFRADEVIKLLQERNEHLQQISDSVKPLVERAKKKDADLKAAYAELHKIWGGHNVVFDRDVYNAVNEWWEKENPT